MRPAIALVVLSILALAACGSDPSNSRPDAGTDADSDASGDVTTDTAPDSSPDTDPDVVEDTGPDVVEDTGPDAVEDTGPDGTPDVSPDTAPDATPDTDVGPNPDDPLLCMETGGDWLPETCGHWECGLQPGCRAIIPGCNCGLGRTFVEGEGCQFDLSCERNDELCEDTGGTWDENSCGHYVCGEFPPVDCDGPEPGCDCGPCGAFEDGQGCVENPECGCDEESLCGDTGGDWLEATCGHYICGVEPPIDCLVPVPACDCGDDSIFDPVHGCVTDPSCTGGELCIETGGEWVEDRECGHAACGIFPPASCESPIPSCNCGPGMVYSDELGCVRDGFCGQSEQEVCTLSGGTWDEGTCGHYTCGVESGCLAIIPGCDCGFDSNYEPGVGCVTTQECGACPDPRNPRVQFVARTAEDCAAIFFACDEEQELFSGACGCGCIDPM